MAAFCGALAVAAPAAAQSPRAAVASTGVLDLGQGEETAAPPGRPYVSVVRVATPPVLDGSLDDAIWQPAAKISQFVQQRPLEGAPASEATEVYLAYDSQHIYVGIYAHYSDVQLIRANRSDRDRTDRDDTVAIFFDPFLDQQRGYSFSVNAFGIQADALLSNTGGGPGGGGPGGGGGGGGGGGRGGPGGGGRAGPGDPTWDAIFESAGHLVEDGWTAEMAIPFKSLRYPARGKGQPHRWGLQIQRDIESKDESVVWSPVSRDVMGFLAQMGMLEGMSDLSTSRNLELLPTVTAVHTTAIDTTTGEYGKGDVKEGGFGLKYGITSNMVLDFTYNPDFSQIESDRAQIEVNQRFPLFFSELRPFFLEGQEIFAIQGPVTLVHTRTIVDPRYGAKVTGKVGKATVGLLVADDEAPGKLDDVTSPAYGGNAHFLIGRARYDLYSESYVGVIVTDREFMDEYSRVGGADGQLRFGRNQRLGFRAVSSAHRDSEGVERTGGMVDVGYRKEGRTLSYSVMHFEISPDFRTETSFIRRLDERQTGGNVSYRWWPQGRIINWGPQFNYSRNYNFAGTLQDRGLRTGVDIQFARGINFNASLNRDMERYENIDFEKTRVGMGGGVNTSRRISFGGFVNVGDQVRYVTTDPFLGKGTTLNLFATIRPLERLQSDLGLNTSRLTDPRSHTEVFDIHIFRAQTTYQFTPRTLIRNIMEYNDHDRTLGGNLLFTYRVNAGTAFYLGYDDRFKQGNRINAELLPVEDLRRTNRAVFAKLQVLFRY